MAVPSRGNPHSSITWIRGPNYRDSRIARPPVAMTPLNYGPQALPGGPAQRGLEMSAQPRKTVVFTACAWCGAVLGASLSAWTGEEALTTHSLCADCLLRLRHRGKPRHVTTTVRRPQRSQV